MAETVLFHETVLLEEAIDWLGLQSGQVIVDGTLGLGGHARRILEKILPKGRLLGFDRDAQALAEAGRRLAVFEANMSFIHDDYKNVDRHLEELGIAQVDGMLLDLGVSSMQLESPARGFSFRAEGPLDMRMDVRGSLTAEEIVNRTPEKELEKILRVYGEERLARRVARKIIETRKARRIRTTSELESIIFHAVPVSYRRGRIHPATRSFQALRIAVNGELESLKNFLLKSVHHLKNGGRLVIISFHSLEDREVKNKFREFQKENLGAVLTRKPVRASMAEMARNPRSRSAKLRVFERRMERTP